MLLELINLVLNSKLARESAFSCELGICEFINNKAQIP